MAGRDLTQELFGSGPAQGQDLSEELFGPIAPPPPPPEGGIISALQRGALQTGSLIFDVFPGMAARLVGADEYAEKQFREAAETERKIQEKYAPAVPSYKDIKGLGTGLTYFVESVGELIPSILPSLFTGGVAAVVGRGAIIAAKEAAEKAAQKEIAERGVQALTQKEVADQIRNAGIDAATKTAIKYQGIGAIGGSSLQNVPEVFQNIKEETGEESIGTALAFGGFNSILDAALPLSLMIKARKAGIPSNELAAEWYKRFGKSALKGFATEGATEAAQEMSSAAAEKFVDNNIDFFSERNFERFINAGLKGGLGGGVVSGATDVVLGRKPLTEADKPLDEDIRNTQSDILARRALLDELRAQAAEEGRNRLDPEALKDLGFGTKYSLYNSLLNKDINDPVQAQEVLSLLQAAIDAPETKGRERVVAANTLDVVNQYLSSVGDLDVGQVITEPVGAGISVPATPVEPTVTEGVGGVERTGVAPVVPDVGAPVVGEEVAPAPVTPTAAAPVQPIAEPTPVEAAAPADVLPTTQQLIAEQEAAIASQMEKFQNLLKQQIDRFGLKDVAVRVVDDMQNANAQYTKGLIKLAVDAADPVRDLRHESVHALKELGFFSPAQWQALVRRANESWINTYLQNRDIDGNFIEPGKESRYDAYIKLFKQQGLDEAQIQEALVEEAISDAFGDFSLTKAPPGMMQAILNRMKKFFRAIKETVTGSGVVDPEEIFGKIEKAEIAAPAKPKSEVAAPAEKKTAPVETPAPAAAPPEPPEQKTKAPKEKSPAAPVETPKVEVKPEEAAEKYTIRPTPPKEVQDAKIYEAQNGILPYTSEGQLDVPRAKYSIKREGKYANHPLFDIPLNKNGTVTLYYPTTNEMARQVIRNKKLFGATPTSNRVYLTNESSGPKVMSNPGNIDQPMNGANILFQVDPDLLQLDMEHPDGRKDFFIPIAEGEAFAQKMAMSKLFTLNAPRAKALSKDTKLTDLERRITDGINQYLDLDPAAQRERLKQAKDLLKREHNVTTLLGENGKLEKTRIGDYGLTYEGKGVSSLGLGLASAQRINEQNLSTCPKSAICEGLCLGETSGQNLLYGGEGQFKSGPRLSQYLKTEAMVLHPEDFAIALHDEISKFARNTKRDDMQPAIRLNVTSDFRPQTWGVIMGAFPDVMFYDYTKLPTKPAAPNHHLTYSSTGASQVVGGKTIINPETNWDKMVQQMLEGNNVAMAFTSRKSMPEFVVDERTGEQFQVWNGDNYDARFLDPKPGEPGNRLGRGMIIGLTNKDKTTNPDQAAEKYKGFFVDYDPARDGKTLTIPNQKALTAGKAISIIRPPEEEVTPPKYSISGKRITDTPELREAAKKSAIVDKDGNLIPMYHGTGALIRIFRPKQAGATFVSPSPDFASGFTSTSRLWMVRHIGQFLKPDEIKKAVQELRQTVYSQYGKQSKTTQKFMDEIYEVLQEAKETGFYNFEGELEDSWYQIAFDMIPDAKERVMELYVLANNPFDFEKKDDVNKVIKKMLLDPEVKKQYGYEIAPKGVDIFKPENFMLRQTLERNNKDYKAAVEAKFKDGLSRGRWTAIETPEVQRAIRGLGFDSFYVFEGGVKNLGVYDPKLIKSADENFGPFGQRPPSEEEARAADMTPEEALEAQMQGDIRFSLRAPQTPEFKRWFGDSKVVDENGEPLVVYHGTYKTFNTFATPDLDSTDGQYGEGIYLAYSERAAEDFGDQVMPLFVRLENPAPEAWAEGKTAREIMAAGYDGVIAGDQVVVYRPEQVKSATGNIGTFDPTNPNIRFSLRAPQTDAFRRWFKDSKVVDENGEPMVVYHGSPDIRTLTAFSKDVLGMTTGSKSATRGFFFVNKPAVAGQYAGMMNESQRRAAERVEAQIERLDNARYDAKTPEEYRLAEARYQAALAKQMPAVPEATGVGWTDMFGRDYQMRYGEGSGVLPVYLALKNPMVVEQRNAAFRDKTYDDLLKEAKRKRHDGLVIKNTDDAPFGGVGPQTIYVAFRPEQIKSAIGNSGAFDPTNPDIRFSLRSALDPAINARILQTTTERDEASFPQRITDAIGPQSRSRFRAAALNRYNRLGELDKEKMAKMGGAELLADSNAESAALLSDLSAGIVAGALGVYDGVGGVPVYKHHFVVERQIMGPRGPQFVVVGGKIQSRQAAEALARRYPNSKVKERGFTAVSNLNNTVEGPLKIFTDLAKMGDPYAYRAYLYWAGVKRGSKWMTVTQGPQKGQVVEQLFEPADIQKAEKLRQEFKQKYKIDFEKIQKEWIKYNDELVQYALDTGVISKENAEKFRKHGDYIPFYRQINGEDDAVGPRIFQSISAVQAPRKIKGGEDPLGDFLENVVRNTQSIVQAGLKNVAARRAADQGMDLGFVNQISQSQASPVNSFYVLEDGKKVYYDTSDVLLIDSIKSLGMPEIPLIGLLAGPANTLRNLVTKDPGFMLANMMRDSLAAWNTSGVNMLPIAATLKNFTEALAGTSPEYKALLMGGVVGGYDYSQGTKDAAKQFGKELRKAAGAKTLGEKALTPFTSVWDGLEKGTQASDAATRIEVYKQTLKDTGNEAEALFRALEVMNFNRKGNNPIVRVATAAIPFLNARMQGLDVLYRAGLGKNATANAKEIQKAFWRRGMYMAALSTMYWMLTHDDEEYKKQEQETKDNNWLFPSLGIKIPIPFEIGVLFKVIPERIAALTLGDDTAKDFTKSMVRNLANTLAFNPIPQTFVPIVEAVTNYDFFTMRPIVGQGLEGVAPEYQIGPRTSRLGETLGKAIGISPMKVDQIIQGYTGTLGQYMSDLIDSVYDLHTENPKASKRFEQMPVFKRFMIDPDARGQVTAYFDLKNAVDEATRTANLLERSMDFKEWGKYYSENIGLFAVKDYVLDMDKTLTEYREMKNMIRSLPMDADAKRDNIRAITQIENMMVSNIQLLKANMLK